MRRFFTRSQDSHYISEFFSNIHKTELDWESTFLQPKQLVKFRGPIFVCEQKLGDLVLAPPKSCHQVINKGGLTVKTSWSRMTNSSVKQAVREECLIYRR